MRKLIFILSFLLFVSAAFSQPGRKGLMKGVLKDSLDHAPLEAVTVSLVYLKDSVSGGMALSKKNGSFLVEDLSFGNYDCYFSLSGYNTLVKKISVGAGNRLVNFDTIFLSRGTKELSEVVILAPPIRVKEDTLEYNASAFKAPPNARLEELLKRLPGLKIEKDGGLSFNGEPITQIMVDGKPFFFNDPRVAAKNLPADIVEKVQIIDQKSKENEIRKISDDNTQKVLNLTLKKDKKKGVFGNLNAAYGTAERYALQTNINLFNNERKISFIGGANNVNNAGFSGTGIFIGGRSGGISETKSFGINYKDVFGRKKALSVSSSYFYGTSNNAAAQTSSRKTLLVDSSFYTDMNMQNDNHTFGHRFHADAEYKPDTLNFLRVTADLNLNKSDAAANNDIDIRDDDLEKINSSLQKTGTRTNGYNTSVNANYIHSFKNRGQYYSVTVSLANNYFENENTYQSLIHFFKTGVTDTVRRRSFSNGGVTSPGLNFSYAHPLAGGYFAEANFSRTENAGFSNRNTSDYNKATQAYDKINSGLTNNGKNSTIIYNYGGGLRVNKKKYNWYAGLTVQAFTQVNRTTSKDSLIVLGRLFINYRPGASFNYKFSKTKALNLNYSSNARPPSVQQLSPVVDSTNRLFIRSGNPLLKPEITHRINISYNNRDYSHWALSLSGFYAYTFNRNASLSTYDSNGVQFAKPVNVDGSYNTNGRISLNIPLRNKKINASCFLSPSFNQDVNFINGSKNFTRSANISQGITFSYRDKKTFDIFLSAAYSYNNLTYSVQPTLNTHLFGLDVDANVGLTLPGNWRLNLNLDYNQNTFAGKKFNHGIALLNGDISKQFFKDKRAEMRFRGFDLLKQNQNYYRTSSENYIEDVRTLVLAQYFLLSFTYNLNRFGGTKTP